MALLPNRLFRTRRGRTAENRFWRGFLRPGAHPAKRDTEEDEHDRADWVHRLEGWPNADKGRDVEDPADEGQETRYHDQGARDARQTPQPIGISGSK